MKKGSAMEEIKIASLNKDIMLALDDSENSRRAVAYTAHLVGGLEGIRLTLLHVIPVPEEDFFPDEAQRDQWLKQYREKIEAVLEEYRQMLMAAGFREEVLKTLTPLRHCPSMAECILSERNEGRYGTIVVGRQGLSRKEEFLFGSISSKIVNHARQCTVWVVE
jgi:nucleotide-binding universal stress UspA family protein